MKKTSGSIGGCFRTIRLINYKSVSLFKIKENHRVELHTIEDPVVLLCSPRTVGFEEKAATDELQGSYMQGQITGAIPRLYESVSARLSALASQRFIVLVDPLTGGTKVFGTPDYPLRLTYAPTVSSDYRSNLYELTLSGDYPEESRFLDSLTRIQ